MIGKPDPGLADLAEILYARGMHTIRLNESSLSVQGEGLTTNESESTDRNLH